jgi:serine/threonine protein kinase
LKVHFLNNKIVFHSKNLINRDIKPENFVIGREDISLVYMIDFGLSKYFRNSDGKHIEYIFNKGMIGTARYSSINALEGKE